VALPCFLIVVPTSCHISYSSSNNEAEPGDFALFYWPDAWLLGSTFYYCTQNFTAVPYILSYWRAATVVVIGIVAVAAVAVVAVVVAVVSVAIAVFTVAISMLVVIIPIHLLMCPFKVYTNYVNFVY